MRVSVIYGICLFVVGVARHKEIFGNINAGSVFIVALMLCGIIEVIERKK